MIKVYEDDSEAVDHLVDDLAETLARREASVDIALVALGIAAARLIFGVAEMNGNESGEEACRLLASSIKSATEVFRAAYGTQGRTAGNC